MNWLNIILTVLSSANVAGDLFRSVGIENRAKDIRKKLDEKEREILERIDLRLSDKLKILEKEIYDLKIVIRFLFIAFLIFFILFIFSLIFFLIVLKYKKIL